MTSERQTEIYNEAKRRLDLWLQHSSFDKMTACGSFLRFNMGLGMMGYPFEKESWMGDDFKSFVTEDEYNSELYDVAIDKLFEEHLHLLS